MRGVMFNFQCFYRVKGDIFNLRANTIYLQF